MMCPACVAEMPDEDLFCENCGLKLGDSASEVPLVGCVCGAAIGETDEDGFCLRCGRREHRAVSADAVRQSQPSDHIELALSLHFAAVSDRGRKHARNEDRFGILEAKGMRAMVVCDGVSTSTNAEVASTAVSEGVMESLAGALRSSDTAFPLDAANAVRQSIIAGAARLTAQASSPEDENPPSTTVVSALVSNEAVTVGWLGDSRAYWIDLPEPPGNAVALPLTRDHSWLNSVVGSGEMTPEVAAKSPQAHAITRWIGADAGDEVELGKIDIVRHPLPAMGGILLLCTDGLWNYFSTPEAMAGIVRDASRNGEDALSIGRQLVNLANRRGGHDNITAAVLRIEQIKLTHSPESGHAVRED